MTQEQCHLSPAGCCFGWVSAFWVLLIAFILPRIYEPHHIINSSMRYFEIYESGLPKLTLAHLHRLKKIKHFRQAELRKKEKILPIIYGGADPQLEADKIGLERQQHELDMLADKIAFEVEKAEVTFDDKDHINQMAMAEIERIRNQ